MGNKQQVESWVSPRTLIIALAVAGFGLVIGLLGLASEVDHFFHIYFLAFVFWLQVALGCLGIVLLLNILDNPWGFAIRRLAEAGARTMPLLGLLFLPLLLGLDRIFPWATPGNVTGNQEAYFNTGFFIVRAFIYFAVWIVLSLLLTTWSYQHDESGNAALLRRGRLLAIIGSILYFLTTTFASFDWLMSVEVKWFSSAFGWLWVSQMVLSAFPLIFLFVGLLRRMEPIRSIVAPRVQTDLGVLMFVSLLVWLYMFYIQYAVIWSGNLPKYITWYITRNTGTWSGFVFFVAIFHIVAFILLLLPGLKRVWGVMLGVAALLFIMRFVDLYWMLMPSLIGDFSLRWWDIGMPLAIGGVWFALFLWTLSSNRLVPVKHPELQKVLATHEAEAERRAQIPV